MEGKFSFLKSALEYMASIHGKMEGKYRYGVYTIYRPSHSLVGLIFYTLRAVWFRKCPGRIKVGWALVWSPLFCIDLYI